MVRQCPGCGAKVGGRVRGVDGSDLPLWDARLAARPAPTAKRRAYEERFRRPDWAEKRRRVLERDAHTCRMPIGARGGPEGPVLLACGRPATEAHHLTYDRFGDELDTDLVAACRDCNQLERQQRIARAVLGE